MNSRMIRFILFQVMRIEGVLMLLPCLVSVIYGDGEGVFYAAVAAFLILVGFIGCRFRPKNHSVSVRDGYVATGLSWIVMSLFGCLPFFLSGRVPNYMDAFFETVSGFTTTGASILTDIEAMSKGLLFWRSFTHWIGGMGVIVFVMAIVPQQNDRNMHVMRAEVPGPTVGKMVPRLRDTARMLYILYIGLGVIETILLLCGGMSLYESLVHMFGTAGTGGFGIMNDSMSGYSSYLQNVTTVFMLLFSVNFSCYYLILLGRWKDVLKDEEFRLFWVIVFSFIALITWNIRSLYPTLRDALHQASFTVATIISTTGFVIGDYDVWPAFSKVLILCLMFIGACAGSTGGGVKVSRLLIMFKSLRRNFHMNMHPSEVRTIRINKHVVDEKVVRNAANYMIAYAFILIISMILISLDGFDVETNLSAVMATFNNVGPGLAAVGPVCNFSGFSAFSKVVLIFDMLAGRLEIFPIAILFSKSTWRKQ